MSEIIDPILGITQADVDRFVTKQKTKSRRDQRVCVCGHSAGSHFDVRAEDRPVDTLAKGDVGCQSGKVPCQCNEFKWVLTMTNIRSFIQKTTGPDDQHALSKGLASSLARGLRPEWREGIRCFYCKRPPEECGRLVAIAYNERGGEAFRSTPDNRLHCQDCRESIRAMVTGA